MPNYNSKANEDLEKKDIMDVKKAANDPEAKAD
jgi:hypothetical protein